MIKTGENRGEILVVDDSEFVCALVSEVLTDAGWRCTSAYDGATACRSVRHTLPDAVICDLHMPDMSGFEVIDDIQSFDVAIPVIILSADDEVDAVLRAVRRGAFDYIVKSKEQFGPLVAAIERACLHSQLTRENRLLRNELRSERDRALAANRAKSNFLANMSHELRTPLNAILGYAELIGEELVEMSEDQMVTDIDHICTSGRHLLGLIDNILDLAKVESGRITLEQAPVDVPHFLSELNIVARQLAATKKNRFTMVIDKELGNALLDEQKLRQCLLNLIGNAAKFTRVRDHPPDGGRGVLPRTVLAEVPDHRLRDRHDRRAMHPRIRGVCPR